MQKTEAIIFDLGGVILNIDYELTQKAFENKGVLNFKEMYSQVGANDLFKKLETGAIDEKDFYKAINHLTGLNLNDEEIESAWNAMLLTFRETSIKFLEKIRRSHKIFLLSNTNFIHLKAFRKIYERLQRAESFESLFEKAYYSCEMGLRKPDQDIYQYVLAENRLNPNATLFIDDSVQNVDSAVTTGMKGLVLLPGKFIEDLDF
jgi:glucose-1-phosphatase